MHHDQGMADEDQTTTVERDTLGAILAACPRCGSFEPHPTNRGDQYCPACGHRFTEPAYYQRVPPPAVEGLTPDDVPALTREEIEAVLEAVRVRRRPPFTPPTPDAA
jgi:uncharacterized Zn finger protein (UPF0148 family)